MISVLICVAAFAGTFVLSRRSLVWGLASCIGLGYAFGAIRANLLETFSFVIWDASVLGVYASYFSRRATGEELQATDTLRLWVAILILWPVLIALVPVQYPLIRLVGLRGNVFLLPFLLIGARLRNEELDELAVFLAAFNIMALGLAVTEYFVGLETFFPRNQVTELMYNSKDVADVAGSSAFRIPAFFVNAAGYSGTMVTSMPFLMGAWIRVRRTWTKNLISAGIVAALFGVFLGASRSHTLVLFTLVIVATVNRELRSVSRASLVLILVLTGWVVSNNQRLQRFTTLFNTEFVVARVSSSINLPILDAAMEYPFGVGMGGGGTSIPYFLQDEILQPVAAENEYVRIMLEEGVLGVFLWLAFVVWIVRQAVTHEDRSLGRKLASVASVAYFVSAFLGTGLLTAVPQSLLLLLATGWASSGMEHVAVP